MAITQSDVRDAAARVSSAPPTSHRRGGLVDRQAAWGLMRGKIARVVVADPDVLLYMQFLCSNKASAQVTKVAGLLAELIPLVEGWKYKSVTPETSMAFTQQVSRISRRRYLEPATLDEMQTAVNQYVEEELAPAATSHGRSQVKGDEARTKYGIKKAELLKAWKRMKFRLALLSAGPRMDTVRLQEEALALPLENLNKTIAVEDSGSNSEEKLLQVLAASAAVQLLGREVSARYRVRLSSDLQFPTGIEVTSSTSGGQITQLEFNKSPAMLGIKSGDLVSWGGGAAVVSQVEDSIITLRSSSILAADGVLTVYPAAYGSLEAMLSSISTRDAELPSVAQLSAEFTRREEGSAAHIKKLVGYLIELLSLLADVPASVTSVGSRLGAEYVEPSETAEEILGAYAPVFGAKTTKAGDQLLDDLDASGYDYASDLLMRGNVQSLLDLDENEASRMGRVAQAAGTLSAYSTGG